jgi:ribose transport system substrate-binding protein
MKKHVCKVALFTLMALAMVFSTVACGSAPAQTSTEPSVQPSAAAPQASVAATQAATTDKGTMKIVLIPKLVHEFYNLVLDGANKAVEELKAEGKNVEVTWSAPTAADTVQQTEKLEAAVALKPNYIGIAVINGESCKPLLQQAESQGIKTIAFDTNFDGSPCESFVGCSLDAQYQSGAMAADALVKLIGKDSGKLAMLTGSPDAENHKQFSGGFRDRIKSQYPGYTIVTEQADNDDKEKATQLTEAILAQYPDIDGIFGGDGSAGVGASIALKAAVEAGQIPEGQVKISNYCLMKDPEAALRSGYLSVIIDYPPYWIGYYTVMAAAADYFDGVKLQDVPLVFGEVTMDNVDTYLQDYLTARASEGIEYWKK